MTDVVNIYSPSKLPTCLSLNVCSCSCALNNQTFDIVENSTFIMSTFDIVGYKKVIRFLNLIKITLCIHYEVKN